CRVIGKARLSCFKRYHMVVRRSPFINQLTLVGRLPVLRHQAYKAEILVYRRPADEEDMLINGGVWNTSARHDCPPASSALLNTRYHPAPAITCGKPHRTRMTTA